ncbi:MAG: response regulator [Candidatus Omnitrophota bacterium]
MKKHVVAIIDDEKEVIETVSEYLEERGFIVIGFLSPEDFLVYLEKDLPDIVLLDLMFPEQINSGYEINCGYSVCKHMSSIEHLANIPIIMISANSSEEDKVDCFNLGAIDYIVKPFSLEKLKNKIERALEGIRILKIEQRFKRMKKRAFKRRRIEMAIMMKRAKRGESKEKRLKRIIDQLTLERDEAAPEHGAA